MKTTKKAPKFKPSSVTIFEEADGFHFSAAGAPTLDARGKGHKSRAAALRAAREEHDNKVSLGLI